MTNAFIEATKGMTLRGLASMGQVAPLCMVLEVAFAQFEMADRMIAMAIHIGAIIASLEAVGPSDFDEKYGTATTFDDRLRVLTEQARIAYRESLENIKNTPDEPEMPELPKGSRVQ